MLRSTRAACQWLSFTATGRASPWLLQSHRFVSSGRRNPLDIGIEKWQFTTNSCHWSSLGPRPWTHLIHRINSSSASSVKMTSEDSGRRGISSGTDPALSALSCSESPPEPTDPYMLIGNREVVGFGANGSPSYVDDIHYPYPAIRFREITPAYKALKEKERGDWKALTLLEKKCIYRISFCQTIAEMMAPSGEWKSVVGWAFFWLGIGFLLHLLTLYSFYSEPWPETFTEERQKEQLKRMRDLGVGRIDGINQYTVYENPDDIEC